MNYREVIITQYSRTFEVVMRLTDGVTHTESLVQWGFDANCMNWLLGHITVSRLNMLAMLGDRENIWDFAQAKRYIPGTSAITQNTPDLTPFEAIRTAYEQAHTRFVVVVNDQSDETFLNHVEEGQRVGDDLLYYAGHEAFHSGQIELCRMMIGKPKTRGYE